MNVDFVYRCLRTAAWVTVVFTPAIALHSPSWALGFFLSSAWSVVNVWAIVHVTTHLIAVQLRDASPVPVLVWLFIKFPILYGIGYGIIKICPGSPVALLVGFHVIFAVFVLKAVALSMGLGTKADSVSSTESPGASPS